MKRFRMSWVWLVGLLVPPVVVMVVMAVAPSTQAVGLLKIGAPAPAFSLTSVTGDVLALDDFRGQVVVLGLFHICQPCRVQSSNLQAVHDALRGRPAAVLGVNSSGDSHDAVTDFLASMPVTITYPYFTDPDRITDALYGGGRFIPNVYVVDKAGVIRWQRVGNMALAGPEIILREVEALLAEDA